MKVSDAFLRYFSIIRLIDVHARWLLLTCSLFLLTGLAYLGTLCVTPWFPWYQVSIVESSNEWVDLAAARAIGHA